MGIECSVEGCPEWKDGKCTDDNIVSCFNRSRGYYPPDTAESEEEEEEENGR